MPDVWHAHGPADKGHAAYVEEFNGFSGKEGVMLEVDYPPGGSDPIHRHNAYAFVYILEGTVVMQLKGGSVGTSLSTVKRAVGPIARFPCHRPNITYGEGQLKNYPLFGGNWHDHS